MAGKTAKFWTTAIYFPWLIIKRFSFSVLNFPGGSLPGPPIFQNVKNFIKFKFSKNFKISKISKIPKLSGWIATRTTNISKCQKFHKIHILIKFQNFENFKHF